MILYFKVTKSEVKCCDAPSQHNSHHYKINFMTLQLLYFDMRWRNSPSNPPYHIADCMVIAEETAKRKHPSLVSQPLPRNDMRCQVEAGLALQQQAEYIHILSLHAVLHHLAGCASLDGNPGIRIALNGF